MAKTMAMQTRATAGINQKRFITPFYTPAAYSCPVPPPCLPVRGRPCADGPHEPDDRHFPGAGAGVSTLVSMEKIGYVPSLLHAGSRGRESMLSNRHMSSVSLDVLRRIDEALEQRLPRQPRPWLSVARSCTFSESFIRKYMQISVTKPVFSGKSTSRPRDVVLGDGRVSAAWEFACVETRFIASLTSRMASPPWRFVMAGLCPERVRRDESRLYVADFPCGWGVRCFRVVDGVYAARLSTP